MSLKQAILDSGVKQFSIAHQASMTERKLSGIVTGRLAPTSAEKKALAKILKKSVKELFGETK